MDNLVYDFSWIEESIKKWPSDLKKDLENTIRILPMGLRWWIDLFDESKNGCWTHLGERVTENYYRQKEEFIQKMIRKYAR